MKVGIITFQKSTNYGAVLQSLALQKTIQKYGIECEVIDYKRDNIRDSVKWIKNKLKGCITGRPDKQLYSCMEFFNIIFQRRHSKKLLADSFRSMHEEICYSKSIKRDKMHEIEKDYDFFIAGSDQVWNPGRVNLDSTYLLGFVKDSNKKGSYAASFGISELPEKYKEDYRKYLNDFKAISCREKEGVQIIKEVLDRDAALVLDPTFLMTQTEWRGYVKEPNIGEPYIIIYQLGKSDSLVRFAKKLAHDKKINRILNVPFRTREDGVEWAKNVGPEEWLGLICNAEYIVTNSFHGTVFSILFEKKFFVEVTKERLRQSMGSRIFNLVDSFGLQSRIIEKNVRYDREIDYERINQIIENERERSLDYLKNMLGINIV